jgi:phospholipid/cholesterol/gamma-HCH transport system ATP-binding protein
VDLRRTIQRALASGDPAVNRLSYAGTSVTFRTAGTADITLLLDRRPPVIAGPEEPAEIVIELTAEQAARFAGGALPMPSAIVNGEVATRGPVRKYLEVDPIMRRLLADAADGPAPAPGAPKTVPIGDTDPAPAATETAPIADIDPSLLAIETCDLRKSFGSHQVLDGVNLRIPEGVVSVVLGPSGTGKSVLLQHIIGLMRPDNGEVLIRGRHLNHMSRSQMLTLRSEMGVMFQDGALFSTMNVHDNVAFPLRQHTDLHEQDIHDIVTEHLTNVGLANAATRMPNQLSGGMRKRAGLARALVMNPGIVLCDEPDSGLDPVRTALLGDLLLQQHQRLGGTMLVITHDVMLARRISDHISILWQGTILETGTSQQIFASQTPFVQQFLSGQSHGPLSMDA